MLESAIFGCMNVVTWGNALQVLVLDNIDFHKT